MTIYKIPTHFFRENYKKHLQNVIKLCIIVLYECCFDAERFYYSSLI